MKIRQRDRSGTRDYKFVVEDIDRHGNVRLYFRRGRERKVRLLQKPGTPAFEAEYMRAYTGTPIVLPTIGHTPGARRRRTAAPGTLRWLVEQYYASSTFGALGESTRKVRRGTLDAICERAGEFPFSTMLPRHVAILRDEKASQPDAGNARVKALRQLFAWAGSPEYSYTTKNPAREVSYLKSRNPDGFRAWSEDDVAKYEARHPIGTKARLALDLLLYTGVRRSDVVKLGPQMERDGKLVFTETKGRARIVKTHELPILPPLRTSIDAAPIGHLVYLVTLQGRPHSAKAFGGWFKRRCREAGLDTDLAAHGLRKLGATRCAEAGATEYELMALFGWSSSKLAGLYTRKANRLKLEAGAAPLLMKQPIGNKSVPLFPMVVPGGTIRAKK